MLVGYALDASQFLHRIKLDNKNSILSQLYVVIVLHDDADCTDNGFEVEGVIADDDDGGVEDGDGVSDGDGGGVGEDGGVDDGDPMALPCAALPRIDEVSWFRASVSGAVP